MSVNIPRLIRDLQNEGKFDPNRIGDTTLAKLRLRAMGKEYGSRFDHEVSDEYERRRRARTRQGHDSSDRPESPDES